MKNKTFLLAAVFAAAWAAAPEAGAVSTYSCVKNNHPFLVIKSRISYRTVRGDGSIHWKRSPWSKAAPIGRSACIGLGRAPVGHNFYVEVKEAAFFWSKPMACQNDGSSGAVKRTSNRRNASPKHSFFTFEFNKKGKDQCYKQAKWDNCRDCMYKDW